MGVTTGSLEPIIYLVRRTISRHEMLEPSTRVLVALSGGADSTALMALLRILGYPVVAGHVDHGLHPGSRAHALHAERSARSLGIDVHKEEVEVDPPTEAQARDARYSALQTMAARVGAGHIATGHTLDDDAETVLMRMARGGFPRGIPPVRDGIVRPLIDLRRSDTEKVCRMLGLEWIDDPTNEALRYTRNLVRHRVLPRFDDRIVTTLAAAGRRTSSDTDELADDLVALAGPAAVLERSALEGLSERSTRALMRKTIERMTGATPSERLISAAVGAATNTGSSVDLPGGSSLVSEPHRVVIAPRPQGVKLPDVKIAAPGMTTDASWGLEVIAEIVDVPADPTPPEGGALLDADVVGGQVVMRQRRPGDRMSPLGMEGTKKLQDVFTDLKIPRYHRDRVPVFTAASGEIVWVAGGSIDHRFRLTPSTRRALLIRVRRVAPAVSEN